MECAERPSIVKKMYVIIAKRRGTSVLNCLNSTGIKTCFITASALYPIIIFHLRAINTETQYGMMGFVHGKLMSKDKSPVREYRSIIIDGGDTSYTNRIMIGTAATGVIRIEWAQARYGQMVPVNWSEVSHLEYLSDFVPLHFQVADAQNVIVQQAIEREFEWLLLWEHDVIPQPDALIKINKYIRDEQMPVVSGLYYTRGHPTEPLVFRGRGVSVYDDWKLSLIHI